MEIRSLILYACEEQHADSIGHATVTAYSRKGDRQPAQARVRAEACALDYRDALNHARPRKGETVLNSIPFTQ